MMSVVGGGAAGPSVSTVGGGVRGIASGVGKGLLVITPAAWVLSAPSRAYSVYKHGTRIAASYYQLKALLPAFGPEKKLGIRGGTEPTTKPLGEFPTPITQQYGPGYMDRMPMLYPDIGIMAVPNDSSRWLWESKKKSTRDEHTSSSRGGTSITRKTMRGGSAQRNLDKTTWAGRKTRSRASSQKPAGRIPLADRGGAPISGRPRRRTPKTLRYRKGGCPPGYRYDPRRKMCVRTY